MVGNLTLGITTYFESLKSKRRLKLITEVANDIETQMRSSSNDIISEHIPQLEDYDVWAGDGHWHEHATHDKRDCGKYYAVGHLYGWDLRHNALHHLVTADQVTRKKEHDIRGLKRLSHDELRVGAPKGRKVIWIWDKAGIDFRQWHTWKSQSGIYFISLEKENMKLDDIAINKSFGKEDPVNAGVISDELCATSVGIYVRRVKYIDPATGNVFSFITNVTTDKIPPGAIAQLYRMRWDIEKVFDDVKNKINEQKAWATSETAKTIQAITICITINLMRNLERIIEENHEISYSAESERREGRMNKIKREVTKKGGVIPALYESLLRQTQTSVKFIRWIRYRVWNEASDEFALNELRVIYAKL